MEPADALTDARGRIGDDDPRAWVTVATSAQASAWRPGPGPLAGTTMGVKDIIDLAGMPTRCGSSITSEAPATRSASFVDRLVGLGAMPVGKTVTTEFAAFDPGPTRNPNAPGRTPGGSSSGSAAAVAAGHVPLAIGTQTAGSVTRPSSYCGVAGFVLSHGTVPLDGFSVMAPSLDTPGLIASGVAGLDTAFRALFPATPTGRAAGRVLVWTGEDIAEVSHDMHAAVTRSAARLAAAGIEVVAFGDALPLPDLVADHVTVMLWESARTRPDLVAARDRLSPLLRELLESGAAVGDDAYGEAIERAAAHRTRLSDLLGDDTVVLGPGTTGAAPLGLGSTGSPIMSRPWQLLGLPQVAVPGRTDPAGNPLGVQLVAPHGAEATLLATALLLENEARL